MLKKEINSLKISRDREIELKIQNLVKPTKGSQIILIGKKILWCLALIICLPLIFFPIVGWFMTIIIIIGLVAYLPSSSEEEKKFKKDMSSYKSQIENIRDQTRIKYNKLIQLKVEKEKEESLASKVGLSVEEYKNKEAEKQADETAQTVKQKAEEMRIRKQKAKEIFAGWSIGAEEDILLAEAALIVIQEQSGSTSLIQRKLRIGYNKASSIIDQLEAAGIITPYALDGREYRWKEGKVVFTDLIDLYE
jgi:hypothetical protein